MGKSPIRRICGGCGRGILTSQNGHKCTSSDHDIVRVMMVNIPHRLKTKLAYSIIREITQSADPDDRNSTSLSLSAPKGGKPLQVCIAVVCLHYQIYIFYITQVNLGPQPSTSQDYLTHEEAIKMS